MVTPLPFMKVLERRCIRILRIFIVKIENKGSIVRSAVLFFLEHFSPDPKFVTERAKRESCDLKVD